MTNEEAQAECVAAMGLKLGIYYHRLRNECADLHRVWGEYLQLFGTDEKWFDIMNSTAPTFFARLQPLLWDWTLMHISKLTDPPTSGRSRTKKNNLTVLVLPKLLPDDIQRVFHKQVKDVQASAELARDWRNRRIAHLDLKHATAPKEEPLQSVTRKLVTDCVQDIGKALNTVEFRFLKSTTYYDFEMLGGANQLLRELRNALAYREGRSDRIISCKDIPADWVVGKPL